jgi:hypothetical protein
MPELGLGLGFGVYFWVFGALGFPGCFALLVEVVVGAAVPPVRQLLFAFLQFSADGLRLSNFPLEVED